MNKRWFATAGLIIAVVVIWLVQYTQPYLIGADGNLHARMALMISESGFIRNLPQAHFSWFAVRFSDKDFLYHLYLVPFVAMLGYTAGAKLAAAVAFTILAASVHFVLRRLVSWQFAFLGTVMLVLSPQFLRDMSEPRPFVFAVALTILGIDAIQRKSLKRVFAVGLLYGMNHLSAWVLPVYAVMLGIYEWIRTGRIPGRVIAVSAAAYAVSFLLHPNFPNNIFYAYINGVLVPWYAIVGGVLELGAEFFPITTRELAVRYPGIILGGIMAIAVLPLKKTQARPETAGWGIAAILFGLFGIISIRNLTHLYPVSLIFFMLVAETLAKTIAAAPKVTSDRVRSLAIPSIVAAVAVCGFFTITTLRVMLTGDTYYADHFTRVARYFEKNIPEGSRIFHTNWSDTQFLIGMAPQYEYLVTLDPVYMYSYDKPLYALYRRVSFGTEKDPYTALTKVFGTYYGYAGKNYFGGLIDQIRNDPRFTVMAEDELGVVFSLVKE